MGFVRQNEVVVAICQGLVGGQIRVGRDRDPAPFVVGVFKCVQREAKILGGFSPVVHELLTGHDDEAVLFALVDHALDDAETHKGLASTGAIGEQHAIAAGLFKSALGETHVFVLRGEQEGECGGDVIGIARLDRNGLRRALRSEFVRYVGIGTSGLNSVAKVKRSLSDIGLSISATISASRRLIISGKTCLREE